MKRIILFMLMTLAVCMGYMQATAQDYENVSREDPQAVLPLMNVDPNTIFVVPVTVNNLVDLENLVVLFEFDHEIITYQTAFTFGGVLSSTDYKVQIDVLDPNKIRFRFTSISPNQFTGSGEVGYIRFLAGDFGTSLLVFDQFIVNGTSYPNNVQNGEVIITTCLNANANAGMDATICDNETLQLNGSASNYESVQWNTEGDGTFDDPNILNPEYTPGDQDIANGQVLLCLTADATDPCLDDTDCMFLYFAPSPTANAGQDAELCADGSSWQLSGMVENASDYFWFTPNGTGDFSDITLLNPVYTPSQEDYVLGAVDLCLTALPTDPCQVSTEDCMQLVFLPLPEVTCPADLEVCVDTEAFDLTGALPVGGTYSGTGVVNGMFDPAVAGPGVHEIAYNYSSAAGCENNCTFVITVDPGPYVYAGDDATICESEDFPLADAVAENYESVQWFTTNGGGNFSDETILNPVYFPSPTIDYPQGSITLGVAASPLEPCTVSTEDFIVLSFQMLPAVDAGDNASICSGDSFETNGEVDDNSTGDYMWTTSGDGFFSDPTALINTYTPGSQDEANGFFTLTLSVEPLPPCTATVSDDVTVTFAGEPVAFAGEDATINIDESYTISDAYALNYTQVFWLSSGDGTFNSASIVNPTYTPGNDDINSGNVTLYFEVQGECGFDADTMMINIVQCQNPPEVFAGNDATICEGSTYTPDETVASNYSSLFWFSMGDGVFNNPGLLNPVYTPGEQDIMNGQVNLCVIAFASDPFCADSTSCLTLSINELPVLTCPADFEVCCDSDPVMLSGAFPAGGMYSGEGVSMMGNEYYFTPECNNTGVFPITYTYTDINGCVNECMFMITVNPLPVVTLDPFDPVCEGSPAFPLYGGMPEGGTYYVDGVEATVFDPVLAGTYLIEYVYTDMNGCTNSAATNLMVNELPVVTCPDDMMVCADADPFMLEGAMPEGGEYAGTGVEDGMFYPATAGVGTFEITYTYSDGNNCENACMFNITVNPLPVVTLDPYGSVCEGSPAFPLYGGMPEGGTYYVDGVEATVFDPVLAGTYLIEYVYTDM
ncbi:MAG: hypothetical protein ACLFPE_04560, partial [Bacteroidales bacterium]